VVNLSVDGWGAPNLFDWLGCYCHYVDKGQPKRLLLDMVHVRGRKTGINMAKDVFSIVESFSLETKVRAFLPVLLNPLTWLFSCSL
jgi:hypothetical protein